MKMTPVKVKISDSVSIKEMDVLLDGLNNLKNKYPQFDITEIELWILKESSSTKE